ncbi:MAG: hypothetical protein KOO63_13695 [Bacteroidales bacterium]|nr:hypothetical protein [Candidatus Latescibacterota bacterium]
MFRTIYTYLVFILIITAASSGTEAMEVNCHDGSSINGIEGFGIQVFCNSLAEKILVHDSLVRDYASIHLRSSGLDLTDELGPESGMFGVFITSVEWIVDGKVRGYATSVNINVNRTALCLLGDDEFHAISSIVWEEDRLVVTDDRRSRDLILDSISGTLDNFLKDFSRADPEKNLDLAGRR